MFGGCFAIVVQAAFFPTGFETIPQGVEEAGGLTVKVCIVRMVVGIVLYLVSAGQRKGLSEAELREDVFGEHTH